MINSVIELGNTKNNTRGEIKVETEYLLVWKNYSHGAPITHHKVFKNWDDLKNFVLFITRVELVGGFHLMKWNGCKLVSLGTVLEKDYKVMEVERC